MKAWALMNSSDLIVSNEDATRLSPRHDGTLDVVTLTDVKGVKQMTTYVSFSADIDRRVPVVLDGHVDASPTGGSTGPHVHDHVWKDRKHVNRAPFVGDIS